MTQTTPSHSQAVEAAAKLSDFDRWFMLQSKMHLATPETIAHNAWYASRAALTSQQEVAAPVSDDDLREALRRIQYEAVSLADAQVIALEALSISRVPVASLASREQVTDAEVEAAMLLIDTGTTFFDEAEMRKILEQFAQSRAVEAVGAVPVMDYEHQRATMEGHRNEAAEIWQSEMDYTDGELRAFDQGFTSGWDRGQTHTAPPSSKTRDDLAGADNWTPEEIEAVIYCLDDDAAAMLNENDEDERAHNMQRAATMIQVFSDLASQPKAPAPVPVVQGEIYIKDWARVELMVSPDGQMHAIGGDRAPGDPRSDLPYIGLERIEAATHPMAVGAVGGVGAIRNAAIEECATLLDKDADRQAARWNEHINSNKGGPATSFHTIPRGYAKELRALKATPAPEQATTGSGQDSDSVHSGSGECGNVQAPEPRKSLNAKVADLLRPFLKPGQKVIWREDFRWHDDNGVLSNHYDGMELPRLSDDFGYGWDFDFDFHHAAIVTTYTDIPADKKDQK